MNPYIYDKILEQKRAEMLADVTRQQMIRDYDRAHPARHARFMLLLAVTLIRLGEKIRNNYSSTLADEQLLCRTQDSQ